MLVLAGILIFILTLGFVIGLIPPPRDAHADSSRIVSLFYDGQKRVITTDSGTVGKILEESGVSLTEGDLVEPSQDTVVPQGFFNINVYRARPVVIVDGATTHKIRTSYRNPALIAKAAGLEVYAEDEYTTDVVKNFTLDATVGEKVTIKRATPVIILADGKQHVIRTQKPTVEGVLHERDVALGPQDTVEPPRGTPVTPNMVIRIFRVKTVVTTVTEKIAFKTNTIRDPELDNGITKVETEGSEGERKMTYRLNFTDGAETKREIVSQELVSQTVTKVVRVGTKVRQDVWYLLRLCESGNNYQRNSGNGYYGAYQFDLSTWRSNGGSGMPHEASSAEQDRVAQKLQSLRGWGPWPVCGRRLGV